MIDIKFGYLFPWHFRFLAAISVIVALGIFLVSVIGAIILGVIGLYVLVASEGTEDKYR